MRTLVAVLDECGEEAASKAAKAIEKVRENARYFALATSSKIIKTKEPRALAAQSAKSTIAIAYAATALKNAPKLSKIKDTVLAFDGRIYAGSMDWSQSKNVQQTAESFIAEGEGDYSFFVLKAGRLLAARDPMGVQPLYYGETPTLAVLASNRKALWALGVEPKSFPPGNLAEVTAKGFKFQPVKTLRYQEPIPTRMEEAAEKLQRLFEESVEMRVRGLKKVAVAFSGGLDSTLVAVLAKKYCQKVELFHVSLENEPETEEALEAAEQLQLPMQVQLYKESDVEKVLPRVTALIEEADPVKASIGVPFFWNAQSVAANGFRVLLAGQGADELFGGYRRYVIEYIDAGDERVRQRMFDDVSVIHETNIERDEKICAFHDVDLRLPFASYRIAEFAMALPTELKIEPKDNSLRKLVLRKVAENLGVPGKIVNKPKKAVQYSTGISNAIKRLARKRNLTLGEYIGRLFLESKEEINDNPSSVPHSK